VAGPCPASPQTPTPISKGHAHGTVTIDALDAIELAEILEYFMERLDVLAERDLGTPLFAGCSAYGLDDLRTDVTRLSNRLHTSPMIP
jgi:hypothetical protein